MEEFGISLKTIRDKMRERDIPHTIEIDDMFSKMGSIDENGIKNEKEIYVMLQDVFSYMRCLLYTSPSPRDLSTSRMPSSA